MKKFKKIMAVLVAAVLMISSFTLTAFAADPDPYGRLNPTRGSITIDNPHSGTEYNIYRLFELASFIDSAPDAGNHATNEHYSYVIDFMPNSSDPTKSDNPWWNFLTTKGPQPTVNPSGTPATYPYAYVDAGATGEAAEAQRANSYFIIQAAPISIKNLAGNTVNTYHVIKAGPLFSHTQNTSYPAVGIDDTGATTVRNNDLGVGIDYADDATLNKVVQDFAQEALKFATNETVEGTPDVEPTYQTQAEIAAVPTPIEVNSTTTTATGTGATYPYKLKTDVQLGYYLIGSSMGTLVSLNTTNPSATMHEKNDEPTIDEKKVRLKGNALKAQADYTGANAAAKLTAYQTDYFGDTANWVKNTDANIGDFVQFRVKIRAQQGMKDYRIHDVMEQGLTFIGPSHAQYNTYPVEVKLVRYSSSAITGDWEVPRTQAVSTTDYNNWVVKTPNSEGDDLEKQANTENADFILQFLDADANGANNNKVQFAAVDETTAAANGAFVDIKDNDYIFVYYWAQLNERAAIFGNETADNTKKTSIRLNDGSTLAIGSQVNYEKNSNGRNDNYTILTYGDKTEITTNTSDNVAKWADASVTTYGFDIVKTDEKTPAPYNLLKDAKFNLYKAVEVESTGSPDFTYTNTEAEPAVSTYYKKSGEALKFQNNTDYLYRGRLGTGIDTNADIKSFETKEMYIRGLEAGIYLLEEVEAPYGYDKLAYPIVLVINGDGDNDGNATTPSTASLVEGTVNYYTRTNFNVYKTGTITWNAGITQSGSEGSYTYSYTSKFDFNGDTVADEDNGGLLIANSTAQELPSTGGMGTTVLYIVGGMMVILAGAYLFFSKRRNAA